MSIKTLTMTILDKMSDIGKWQANFLACIFELHLQVRGRHNFLQFSRYGQYNESTYRENYSKDFDFASFNTELIKTCCSEELLAVFDPCHLSKSGKHTPGSGYFWSGCAQRSKWGLEIGGFAIVDKVNHTAMHLIADQTLCVEDYGSLLEYYTALVCHRSEVIKQCTDRLAVDAYFSKKPFVDGVVQCGLHVVTRLRDDADLRYLYVGPHPKRKGAKAKFAGKVDLRNLDPQYFTCCIEEPDFRVYEATLYSKALKRVIRVAVMHRYDQAGNIKLHKTFCSTDLTLSGIEIFCDYKSRFQIEFLYRDAKQFVGLQDAQSRSETKLHFHFNAALTTVALAKAAHQLNQPIDQRDPFSLADIKTQYFNELLLDRFFEAFAICPNSPNIISIKQHLLSFGKIRA